MSNEYTFERSESLLSCDYNEDEKILTITFKRGKTYKYGDVPKPIYEDLKDAESPGKFFQQYIKPVYAVVE